MAAVNGRSRYRARHRRNILCVFPEYAPSFGTFQHAYKLMPGVRGFMPPQGLLLIAAYMPAEWDVRFIDENMGPAGAEDFAWADAVFVSGMHVQRPFIERIVRRAHRAGRLTVLGGPSVSACPEYYPDVDLLHLGELGDATDAIIAYIDDQPVRPPSQIVFRTEERVALDAFPEPAYDQVDVSKYFLGSVQFSSGCPYRCEFCDIPAALWPQSPAEDAGADLPRAGCYRRQWRQERGLFRRRQFRRQQEGGPRTAAPPDPLAERRRAIRSASPARPP